MIFTYLDKREEKMRTIMAKEPSPIGKFIIQQNLIVYRLIKLIKYFDSKKREKELFKTTLGKLIEILIKVEPSRTDQNYQIYSRYKLHRLLINYNIDRNKFIHHLMNKYLYEADFNDIYHQAKILKKNGNKIYGKLNGIFLKLKIVVKN